MSTRRGVSGSVSGEPSLIESVLPSAPDNQMSTEGENAGRNPPAFEMFALLIGIAMFEPKIVEGLDEKVTRVNDSEPSV
jgi:hypothetical protein